VRRVIENWKIMRFTDIMHLDHSHIRIAAVFQKLYAQPLCLSLSPYPAIFVFRARGYLSICLASCTLVSIRELSLGVRETL